MFRKLCLLFSLAAFYEDMLEFHLKRQALNFIRKANHLHMKDVDTIFAYVIFSRSSVHK